MKAKKKSLLIVDDNEDLCTTLKDILGTKGYQVEVAYDGFTAVRRAKEQVFDIALLDMVMEKMEGAEVMKKIRPLSPETSFFAMTAYSNDPGVRRALANGVLRVFKKPLNIEEMIEIFDEEIAQKRREDSKV